MIIGLAGKKGSGKSTAAEIAELYGFRPIAYADTLKKAIASYFNISLFILNDPVAKESMALSVDLTPDVLYGFLRHLSSTYLPISDEQAKRAVEAYSGPSVAYSPRLLMQVLGTDLVRKGVDKEYWTMALASQLSPDVDYVVHDVRFENEANLIKNKLLGKVVIIEREGLSSDDSHESESVAIEAYDYKLYNSNNIEQFASEITALIMDVERTYGKKVQR